MVKRLCLRKGLPFDHRHICSPKRQNNDQSGICRINQNRVWHSHVTPACPIPRGSCQTLEVLHRSIQLKPSRQCIWRPTRNIGQTRTRYGSKLATPKPSQKNAQCHVVPTALNFDPSTANCQDLRGRRGRASTCTMSAARSESLKMYLGKSAAIELPCTYSKKS